jgi:hypothetical protein
MRQCRPDAARCARRCRRATTSGGVPLGRPGQAKWRVPVYDNLTTPLRPRLCSAKPLAKRPTEAPGDRCLEPRTKWIRRSHDSLSTRASRPIVAAAADGRSSRRPLTNRHTCARRQPPVPWDAGDRRSGDRRQCQPADDFAAEHSTRDNVYGFSFSRRLADSIAIIVDTGAIQQFAPNGPLRTGFDTTRLMLKAQVYKDDPHETLVAASLLWGIGHSGSHAVNADGPSTLEPGFAFGQGLGELPDSLKWLRPIAITGGASLEFPLQRSSTTYFSDPEDGSLELFSTKNDAILHWGFSIQYSTFYMSDRFTGTPPRTLACSHI